MTESGAIEVGIPMRDGAELAADVRLPPAAATGGCPVPALVSGTPYGKETSEEASQAFLDAGYAIVVWDCRGRGKSEGAWRAFVDDGRDGHDAVEWVAAQPWCDGSVAISGLSYSGWVAWATIEQRPPHLRAAISTAPAGRWMEEIPYTHGCFQLYFAKWVAAVRRRIPERARDVRTLLETLPVGEIGELIAPTGRTWRDLMEHDRLDGFWRALRWDGRYGAFDVPVLHVAGWHDREDLHGTFHHYEQMVADSPAHADQWLVAGPWSHVGCRTPVGFYGGVDHPGAAIDADALHVRFLDRYLRGERDGGTPVVRSRVRLYDPGRRGWADRPAWSGDTEERRWPLGPEGTLGAACGHGAADSTAELRYDPAAPPGLRFDVDAPSWEPPLDLSALEAQEGVLAWTSPPLPAPLTVRGWGVLELFAALDGDDADWHVKLADVDPGGRPLSVAWGCLRASHAADPTAPAAVPPGVTRRYAVELSPAFHTFEAGHRLRVLLAGADWPWFARNLNRFEPVATATQPRTARHLIHTGPAHPSALALQVELAPDEEVSCEF